MILGIDTSTNVLSVAVTHGEKVLAELSIDNKKTHSKSLMPAVRAVLESIELEPSEIDRIACAAGPGSFTGIRIGLTAARTLSQALGKEIAAVNTLLALSYNLKFTGGRVLSAIDARGGNVYAAIYSFRGKTHKAVLEPTFISISELNEYVKTLRGKTYAVGETEGISGVLRLDARFDRPSAASLNFAAEAEGKFTDYNHADAVYINKPQAQRELEERERNKK